MRPHGQLKLGFFPLPAAEAERLKNWLTFPERFSALDPVSAMEWHSPVCFITWPLIATELRSTPIGQNKQEP